MQAVLSLLSAIRLILLSTLVYNVVGEGCLWKGGAYAWIQCMATLTILSLPKTPARRRVVFAWEIQANEVTTTI